MRINMYSITIEWSKHSTYMCWYQQRDRKNSHVLETMVIISTDIVIATYIWLYFAVSYCMFKVIINNLGKQVINSELNINWNVYNIA